MIPAYLHQVKPIHLAVAIVCMLVGAGMLMFLYRLSFIMLEWLSQ